MSDWAVLYCTILYCAVLCMCWGWRHRRVEWRGVMIRVWLRTTAAGPGSEGSQDMSVSTSA